MAKFIRRSLIFFIALVAGYSLFILSWGLMAPDFLEKNLIYKLGGKGHMFSRMREVEEVHDVDIVFIGSSLAIRGFDPRIFAKHGYSSFNLGSGGQTPLQSAWLLEKYLDRLNPRLIIFEVNPYIISRDGVEAALDLISNHDFEWSMVPMAVDINNIKVYNALMYSLWRTYLGLNKDFVEPKVKKEDTYVGGGFVQRKISYFNKANFGKEPKYRMKPVDYQQDALERILQMIADRNIKLILIQPPVTSIAFKAYKDDYHVDEFFSGLGTYYNCNHYMTLNDSLDFFDSRHLNQNGVTIFNEKLITEVLNLDSLMQTLPRRKEKVEPQP